MDKNIAALLREDATTIKVRFFTNENQARSTKEYTYVTNLKLKVGDWVVVTARSLPQVVEVVEVHERSMIEPNEDVKYSWVVQRVDTESYDKFYDQTKEIEQVVSEAYKTNLRKSFTQQILSGLESSDAARLTGLLKGPEA